jgi:two-component system, chemotaxis family, CheB/CheR fusion protein
VAAVKDGDAAFEARRVLIIEDDDDSREALATLVALLGHVALSAATPREALQHAAEGRLDLALIDLGLPEMDGCDLARQLRETAPGPMRLVALTGYSDPAVRQRASDAGFDEYVVKPLMRDKLDALFRF